MEAYRNLGSTWWLHPALPRKNPCLTCGACCAALRVSFYWAESDVAVADSVPADMTCRVAPPLCAMRGTDRPHLRCIALRGMVGVRVWCAIYKRRPSVCRAVAPSGQGRMANMWCDRARVIWGLPPLTRKEGPTTLSSTMAWRGRKPTSLRLQRSVWYNQFEGKRLGRRPDVRAHIQSASCARRTGGRRGDGQGVSVQRVVWSWQ